MTAPSSSPQRSVLALKSKLQSFFASKRGHLVFGLLLPLAVAGVNLRTIRHFTIDDAYISYRYANNLVNGHGLVFNIGEYVEGYTNFSWTLLIAAGLWLGIDPNLVVKIFGAAFALGAIATLYFLMRRLYPDRALPCVATWLLASTRIFTGHAMFGLETAMFVCLTLVGMLLFMREEEAGRGWPLSGLVFALAALTRPEAPMFIGILMLFLSGRGLPLPKWARFGDSEDEHEAGDRRASRLFVSFIVLIIIAGARAHWPEPPMWAWLLELCLGGAAAVTLLASLPRALFWGQNLTRGLLFLAPVLAHLAWRVSYYGAWLPNTFEAKTGNREAQINRGTEYLLQYLYHDGPVLYLALFGVGLALAMRQRYLLATAATAIFGGFYVMMVGGDWMIMFRFIAPLQPFLFLLVDAGVCAIYERRQTYARYVLIIFALITITHRVHFLSKDVEEIKSQRIFWEVHARGVAHWFEEQSALRGRDKVIGLIAVGDIGEISYITDFPILDTMGLVNTTIAKLPGGYAQKTGKGYRDYFFESKPRYYLTVSKPNNCHVGVVNTVIPIMTDARFRKQYQLRKNVSGWCIFERKDMINDIPVKKPRAKKNRTKNRPAPKRPAPTPSPAIKD